EPSAVDALRVEGRQEHVSVAGLGLRRRASHREARGPDRRPTRGEEDVALGERVGAVVLAGAELARPLTRQAGPVLDQSRVELPDVRLEVAVGEAGHIRIATAVECDARTPVV